jgi:Ca2+-transporting ATPase
MLEFYYLLSDEVFRMLNSSESGLSKEEAENRLKEHGLNILSKEKPYSRWKVFLGQFNNSLIFILLIAAALSFFVGEGADAQVIIAAVVINVFIGYFQEDKANRALNKLKLMIEYRALVRRDGLDVEVLAADLVPGDVLILRPGRFVLADARLFEVSELEANEASLTGESSAVHKSVQPSEKGVALADRRSMVFAGTNILNGNGLAVVVATGRNTEIGKISEMVKNTENESTPLQERLTGISKFLGITTLFICAIVFLAGILNGFPIISIFSASVAIAVAIIPEGMSVAVTVILALGMHQTVKKKALTRKLLAAETLGSITVICSDKTGTLTEGIMKLEEIHSFFEQFKIVHLLDEKKLNQLVDFGEAFQIGLLCNNAVLAGSGGRDLGSALEVSFLKTAANLGWSRESFLEKSPRLAELPFSSDKKFMISLHQGINGPILYEKGAGEIVLKKCSHFQSNGELKTLTTIDREKILKKYEALTAQGFRVIALAKRELKKNTFDVKSEQKDWSLVDQKLIFVAFATFRDPLRKEAKATIALCKKAGIRPIIITGDHPGTAFSIATELKITSKNGRIITGDILDQTSDHDLRDLVRQVSVFARVSPEHKIRIVKALKHNREVVAMTGDGLNDSPALKAADIGVCLGSGTEVAKETADLVLLDDNFSVIVGAIKQGRIIFDNIRKSLTYLIADSFSEMFLILGSILFHLPLALLPTQILWINIVNDGLPNFSLAFEGGDEDVMDRKPIKRKEPIFNDQMKVIILGVGIFRDLGIFILYYYLATRLNILTWSEDYLRSVFFAIVIFKSLLSIFSIRNLSTSIFKTNHLRNPYLLLAFFAGVTLMFLAIYLPFFNRLLSTNPLKPNIWLLVCLIAIINLAMLELVKFYFSKRKK